MGLVNTSTQVQLSGIVGNCKYSGTVEGIFRANTQIVVKEQGFMRVSPQVDVREQGLVRVSLQVKVGIGTNPPVNAGMWTKESNFKFDFYLFSLPLLKDRVKGSKVSDFQTHWKLFETFKNRFVQQNFRQVGNYLKFVDNYNLMWRQIDELV